MLGIAALATSMTLLAFATTPWQLYIAFALMSLGWIGMGTIVSATIVSLWFVRRRGLAISLAFTGASFSGVILTPSLVYLVERFGFAAAMLTGTAVMVAVLVPVTIAWIGPPSAAGPADSLHAETASAPSDISRAQLIRRVAFWTISIPFALALVAQIGFIVHQIAMLEPKIGRANAGLAVSVMTFMAIAGRFGLGMVIDRFDPRRVTAISIVSQAAALREHPAFRCDPDRTGCLRGVRLFGRQSHHTAAAHHAPRVQRRELCRRHGAVECDQRNHWLVGARLSRCRSELERRVRDAHCVLHRATADRGGDCGPARVEPVAVGGAGVGF